MLPDLESLRCFDAAATRLNFRLAAKQVALSPAAFSDRIRRLESQLGRELFARTTRRIVLTEAGAQLLPQARETIEAARRCLAKGPGKTPPYQLVIGTRFELGLSWLIPAMPKLEATRTERTLHVVFADSPELLNGLRVGSLDCAIASMRITEGNLSYATLHDEAYVMVGAPMLVDNRRFIHPTDAAMHRLLDVSADLPLFRYFLDARPPTEHWGFRSVQHLGTISAVRARVLEGAGVAVLPKYFVREHLEKKALKPLFPKTVLRSDAFRLLWRTGHPREVALQALATELRAMPIR